MKIVASFLMLGAAAGAASPAPFSGLAVEGYWTTPDGSSTVQIRDCGDGTPCGVVVAVDPAHGGMIHDDHNKDDHLRGRHMVGVTLLSGFQATGGHWRAGAVYNPENGRTYRAHLKLLSDDRLAVSGCLGPVCKKLIWERSSARP